MENDPPRPSKKFPGDNGDDDDAEAMLRPLQELQITSSSADVSFRTDRKEFIIAFSATIQSNPVPSYSACLVKFPCDGSIRFLVQFLLN